MKAAFRCLIFLMIVIMGTLFRNEVCVGQLSSGQTAPVFR